MMMIIIMAKMMIMIVMMIRMMIKKPTVADVSLTNPPSRLRLPLWQSPFLGRHCQMEVSGHLRSNISDLMKVSPSHHLKENLSQWQEKVHT